MGGLSRRQKEKRAYTLTLVSGGAAVATVVFLLLWVIGVMSFGPVFLAALIAVIAGLVAARHRAQVTRSACSLPGRGVRAAQPR